MLASSSTRRPRGLVGASLKDAGLINTVESDANMRDAPSVKPNLRSAKASIGKLSNRKVGHRQRTVDPNKSAADNNTRMHNTRLAATLANPLAIRGAATRPGQAPRLRRPGSAMSVGSSASTQRINLLEVWREFVNKRWNPEQRFLNLECMADDDVLKKYNVAPPSFSGSGSKEMQVIFKIASMLKPTVQTISLARNNITSGAMIQTMPQYLPKLSNLSLQGNQIKAWRDMDYISRPKRTKLNHLRELVLLDNPLRDFEINNGRGESYKSEMTRRFPSLELLDNIAVTKISFGIPATTTSTAATRLPTPTEFPFPMAPSFVSGVDGSLISNFLFRFFPLFDNDRNALADVYAPAATFSYSAFTTIPPRARLQGFHTSKEMPHQRDLQWTNWLSNEAGCSRNLSRMGAGLERVINSLHIGSTDIIKAMNALPKTTHNVASDEQRFCVDAWPVTQGDMMTLFVTVHGDFAEAPSQGIRSFDRSFILASAPAGSRAIQSNWDVMILSDQFTVRSYSSHESWAPGPLRIQTQPELAAPPRRSGRQAQSSQTQTNAPLPEPPIPMDRLPQYAVQIEARVQGEIASMPDPQRNYVLTICQRTGLNVKFAIDCLEQNGWVVDKAVADYERVKGTLARDAFL